MRDNIFLTDVWEHVRDYFLVWKLKTRFSPGFLPQITPNIVRGSSTGTITAIMSNINIPGPIPSSAAAETQVPNGHSTPITEPVKSNKRCLVLSLIRHGQVHHPFLILNLPFHLIL